MRSFITRLAKWLASLLVLLLLASFVTARGQDPALYPPRPGEPTLRIEVADHGVHAGLVVRLADLRSFGLADGDPVLLALQQRYAAYDFLEIGWGDEQFYRFAPTLSHVTVAMAFNALSGRNKATVLHVVGLKQDGVTTFPHSDVLAFDLSQEGARRLMAGLSATFSRQADGRPVELGQGIYGPSLFYRAEGHYSALHTCNHWISDLLHNAGLATSPFPAIWSGGLVAELRWRNLPVSPKQID